MKKILALILIIGICFTIFSGCSFGAEESESSETEVSYGAEEPKKVNLQVVTMYGEGDPNAENYSTAIANYASGAYVENGSNAENYNSALADYKVVAPNVNIERNDYRATDEYKAVVNSDFASGNEPDVIYWFAGPQAAVMLDKVVPVSEIQEIDPKYGSNILPNALDAMKESDGVTYAIPTSGFWEGLFINEKLLLNNDLVIPETWEDFIQLCKDLKELDIVPIAQGFGGDSSTILELMLTSGAGEDYGKIPTAVSEISESWVHGLNGLKELYEAGAFPENSDTISHTDAVAMFCEGKAAMIADGSWRCDSFTFAEWDDEGNFVRMSDNTEETDVASEDQLARFVTVIAMPGVTNGKGGSVIPGGSSSGWYITKAAFDNADKREAAIEFVKYMTNSKNIKLLMSGYPSNGARVDGLTKVQLDGYELFKASTVMLPLSDRFRSEAWDTLWKGTSLIFKDADAREVLESAVDLNIN